MGDRGCHNRKSLFPAFVQLVKHVSLYQNPALTSSTWLQCLVINEEESCMNTWYMTYRMSWVIRGCTLLAVLEWFKVLHRKFLQFWSFCLVNICWEQYWLMLTLYIGAHSRRMWWAGVTLHVVSSIVTAVQYLTICTLVGQVLWVCKHAWFVTWIAMKCSEGLYMQWQATMEPEVCR